MQRSWVYGLMALVLTAACAQTESGGGDSSASRPAVSAANKRLEALLNEDLRAQKRQWPMWASRRGDREHDSDLPDPSAQAQRHWVAQSRNRLARLRKLDRAFLSDENRVNLELLEHELSERVAAARFHPEQTPITQLGGGHTELAELPDRLSFTKPEHFRDYNERLSKIPAYIDATIAVMREGLGDGRTPPRVIMKGAAEQAFELAQEKFVEDPTQHPLYKPFLGAGASRGQAERARRTISAQAVPALQKLGAFLRDEYIPACRDSIAAADSVDGPDYYAHQLRHFTTTALGPQQIHAKGLAEVKRVRAEMMDVIARSDYPRRDELEGDELFAAFITYLRTDPRFYCKTEDELLAAYRAVSKKADAGLPALFGRLPRLSYGVRRMPDLIAPSAPTAYYYSGSLETGVAGYFVANTYHLDQRPKYEMVPLTLHEAVPGHHLQISLAEEMTGVHEWRRTLSYTAYVEGWALYAERLGLEMGPGERGLYEDPYDDFGRLSYEMWRSLRLVVDPGIHAFGWSRQKAIDYMLQNSALTRENVEREVDRYISWPGQATAYKIGELKIRALRAAAEQELGERFDIRGFHDVILEQGALPLEVLERRVNAWVARRKN